MWHSSAQTFIIFLVFLLQQILSLRWMSLTKKFLSFTNFIGIKAFRSHFLGANILSILFWANLLASTWFLFSTLALTYSNIVYVFDLKNSNQKYFSLYRCRMKNEELTLLKLFLVFYLAASWISTSVLAGHGIGNTFSRITHQFAK